MDKHGLREVVQALNEGDIGLARVFPAPLEGADVRFITIETSTAHRPSDVLNALQAGGVMAYEGPRDLAMRSGPELRPIGVQLGSLTLEDTNYKPKTWLT